MILNKDNFFLYAAKHYDAKRYASLDEFESDLKRIQYIKRLFRRYKESGDIKTRLILNHLIILYNCFGPPTTNMLFFRMSKYHSELKPFVEFLGYLPEKVVYDDSFIVTDNIQDDKTILEELERI